MDDRTLNDLLRRFGLSDKEVDTYLSLLAHGEAKGEHRRRRRRCVEALRLQRERVAR